MSRSYLKTTTSFSQLGKDEMPREKAMNHGIKSLTDAELMALLFSTGSAGISVLEMAEQILQDNDYHLSRVTTLSPDELSKRYKGIGRAKALLLLASLELGERSARDAATMPEARVLSSKMAYDYMRPLLEPLETEEFHVLMLTNAGTIITSERIASGGQTSTLVDVRVLLRKALECKAVRIILFHNHPSGTLSPSGPDDVLTNKIKDAAALMDIRVDDHIIVTSRGYYSYNDEGRL